MTILAEGDFVRALSEFERGLELAGVEGAPLFALAHLPLTLYWTGQHAEVLEQCDRILERARRKSDITGTLMTLSHRALSLTSLGRYEEALATFREGRELAERYGQRALGARFCSMSVGIYVGLFDYERAQELAEEARALGQAIPFVPAMVSGGLDLIQIAARRGDLERARAGLEELAKEADTWGAWHGWVWRMRLDELRAEIALRAGDHEVAIEAATRALERASRSDRPRYRVWSRCIRGVALAALGRELGDDLEMAIADARATGEPVALLHALRASLGVRPDPARTAEARALVQTVAAAVPEGTTRARFRERATI